MPDTTVRANSGRPIKILIISDRALTILGLKGALLESSDIEVIAEGSTIDGAIAELNGTGPDLTVIDLQDVEERRRALAYVSSVYIKSVVLFLAVSVSDAELVSLLREWTIGFCSSTVTPESLVSTIRSVYGGYTCLNSTTAKRLSDLLSQCYLETNHKEYCALTDRETEVLRLIVSGMTNPQIAKRLIVSQATAKAHVRSILSKLGVPDRTTAAVEAVRRGLVAG